MTNIKLIIFFLICILFTASCSSVNYTSTPEIAPTQTNQSQTATLLPVVTAILIKTSTPSPSPSPTLLSRSEADQAITNLMAKNGSCPSPCFWGIRPGVSTLNDALGIITGLANATGNSVLTDTKNNKISYNVAFIRRGEISIEIAVYEEKGDLSSIHAWASGLDWKEITNQDWLAFRPENILKAYGTPEHVEFNVPMGPGSEGGFANPASSSYDLRFYYDQFLIEYNYGNSNILLSSNTHVCPLADHQIQRFDVWLGKDLENGPVGEGVDLSELTMMSIAKFYALMTSDPKMACLNLNLNVFKP
jgi:hypothetical protein